MFKYFKMNIFIPLCGKGERFVKAGYTSPKPFIQVLSKSILEHTLDSILTNIDDTIYIIHNQSSLFDNFEYKNKKLIFIKLTKTTRGASETLYEGILEGIRQNILSFEDNKRCVCYDCDTFYTIDTLNLYREHDEGNVIFYSINKDKIPLYSYIDVVNNKVSNIVEKEKISDNANSGIYGFSDINLLYKYSKHVIENTNLYMNGECYISCVIKELINNNISISAIEIPSHSVISLGTPLQVENYKNNLHGFLFDLDGTLVLTDDIYIDIWKSILEKYNIVLDETLYVKYIQGNSDLYVMNTLLPNLDISLSDISKMKDTFFINNLSKIKIIPNAIQWLTLIREYGHKIAIVTNSNREVAEKILKYIKCDMLVDVLIIGNECNRSKPYPDPYLKAMSLLGLKESQCFIFEDSKTGLLSGKSASPKGLIAIQSIYDKEEYKSLGINVIIENYNDLSVNSFINQFTSDINPLEEYIRRSLNNVINNDTILSLDINSSKLKGGYITDAIHITIKTCFNSYECVLKLENKQSSFLSKMATDLNLYKREYYFYEVISKVSPVSIPKFYGVIKDDSGEAVGILLENLYSKGYVINIDLNTNDIQYSLNIISECAKLHSSFVNNFTFNELKTHESSTFKQTEFIYSRWSAFKDKWNPLLSVSDIEVLDTAVSMYRKIQSHLSSGNLTVCHGDVKSPNIFYNNSSPCFIDWQYVGYGKGVQDIVFFMIESFNILDIKDRALLFKEYYYVKCRDYGMLTYSKEEYDKDFVYSIFYFPLFVAIWFGTLPSDELIDKNFPFFFIQKLINFIKIFKKEISYYLL